MWKRTSIWRNPSEQLNYSSCFDFSLVGVLVQIVVENSSLPYNEFAQISYKPGCFQKRPIYSTNRNVNVSRLPVIVEDWTMFLEGQQEGKFMYSIYPTVYSLTAATIVTCFLSIIVFTNTYRPSFFLVFGSFLSSVNLLNIWVSSIKFLSDSSTQFGRASGEHLLEKISTNLSFSVIDFFTVFILQLVQVQVIMRLFDRQKEKRFTFIMGISLSVISQVIWAVSTFHKFYDPDKADTDNGLSILPAFIYLLRIAMSVMYSALIYLYCCIKWEFIIKKELILISLVAILSTNLQIAFFVADVSNVWVSELSEVFNATGYVASTVIVWEWINRVHAFEKIKQGKSVLGRPFYEEEETERNKVDRFSLFKDDNDGFNYEFGENYDDFVNNEGMDVNKIPKVLTKAANAFWYFTDQVIAYGLAVPKSTSVGRNSNQAHEQTDSESEAPIYMYSKKRVVIEPSEAGSFSDERA